MAKNVDIYRNIDKQTRIIRLANGNTKKHIQNMRTNRKRWANKIN